MSSTQATRRRYGTGAIIEKSGAYYGKWRIGDRQIKRKLGTIRTPGSRDGLTRTQAEAALRKAMAETTWVAPEHRLTFAEVADLYVEHVEHVMHRKPTTVVDYRSMCRAHLHPHFGAKPVEKITHENLSNYMVMKSAEGLAPKTISNQLVFMGGIFAFALKRGWVATNPVVTVDRPRADRSDPDIRFLTGEEVEALIRAVPDDYMGAGDQVLYLTAAMTGLRQGELIALRWRDVDWTARVVRVRRSYSRGELTTPKSRRSARAVPMSDRVAAELERHFQRSAFRADDDLVFAHPQTGHFLDASKVLTRFKAALVRAKVREVRFHDLRHTYGTRMAAAGAPLRTLQGWMGHATYTTTEIYADFAPDPSEGAALTERAFGGGTNWGTNLSGTQENSGTLEVSNHADS